MKTDKYLLEKIVATSVISAIISSALVYIGLNSEPKLQKTPPPVPMKPIPLYKSSDQYIETISMT